MINSLKVSSILTLFIITAAHSENILVKQDSVTKPGKFSIYENYMRDESEDSVSIRIDGPAAEALFRIGAKYKDSPILDAILAGTRKQGIFAGDKSTYPVSFSNFYCTREEIIGNVWTSATFSYWTAGT